jgi:hypothetical protein
MSCLICNELLHHIVSLATNPIFTSMACVAHKSVLVDKSLVYLTQTYISPPRMSLNYQNQTRNLSPIHLVTPQVFSLVKEWVWAQTWQVRWWWRCQSWIYKHEPNLNLDIAPLLTYMPFPNICLSNVNGTYFMCLTSLSIYTDHWKSFMKFEIKKSHEMISYILVEMALLSAWIALVSEWKHVSLTKPCNLSQMTIDELYNKSHKGFMLRACPENASICLKL